MRVALAVARSAQISESCGRFIGFSAFGRGAVAFDASFVASLPARGLIGARVASVVTDFPGLCSDLRGSL